MNKCKKCGKDFEPVKGLVNYCSLECRNSRLWSEEDKKKKSISAKSSEKVMIVNRNRPEDYWKKIGEIRKENHRKQILESDYKDLSFESLRFRILYEQENKCNKCGLDEWLGQDLVLELEHKDGNNKNNNRDNLEMICPNCHSLTETWRGRNKKERLSFTRKKPAPRKQKKRRLPFAFLMISSLSVLSDEGYAAVVVFGCVVAEGNTHSINIHT